MMLDASKASARPPPFFSPRWHNQPPAILRRIELAGCIGTPQLTDCLAQRALEA
jgi:hypothetical protein